MSGNPSLFPPRYVRASLTPDDRVVSLLKMKYLSAVCLFYRRKFTVWASFGPDICEVLPSERSSPGTFEAASLKTQVRVLTSLDSRYPYSLTRLKAILVGAKWGWD